MAAILVAVPGTHHMPVYQLTLGKRPALMLAHPGKRKGCVIIGYIAELHGLAMALNVLGVCYIALFVIVMLPLIQSVKSIQQRAAA